MPKAMQKTLLLTPGSIAPQPMKTPTIKFFKVTILYSMDIIIHIFNNTIPQLVYFYRSMHFYFSMAYIFVWENGGAI